VEAVVEVPSWSIFYEVRPEARFGARFHARSTLKKNDLPFFQQYSTSVVPCNHRMGSSHAC